SMAGWLPSGSSNAMMGPIGTPIGARHAHRGHSAGWPRSHPGSIECLVTTIASGTCRTVRGFTPSAQLEPPEDWSGVWSWVATAGVELPAAHGLSPCERGLGPAVSLAQPGLGGPVLAFALWAQGLPAPA